MRRSELPEDLKDALHVYFSPTSRRARYDAIAQLQHIMPEWLPVPKAPVRWTTDKLKAEAHRFTRRWDFQSRSKGAYLAARALGVLDEICAHMTTSQIGWTDEAIKADAARHTTRSEWKQKNQKGYAAAYRRGILDEVCLHMDSRGYTLSDLMARSRLYQTRSEFQDADPAAYQYCVRRKMVAQVCEHMGPPNHGGRRRRTNAELIAAALRYSRRTDFQKGDSGAYRAVRARGILEEACRHMAQL